MQCARHEVDIGNRLQFRKEEVCEESSQIEEEAAPQEGKDEINQAVTVITENIKDPCPIVIPMKNNHLREGNGLT